MAYLYKKKGLVGMCYLKSENLNQDVHHLPIKCEWQCRIMPKFKSTF